MMLKQRHTLRTFAVVCLIATTMSVAACSSNPSKPANAGGPAGPVGSSTSAVAAVGVDPHASHDHSSQAPPAAPLRAGERFVDLSMSKPYTPSAPNGGTDEYRCVVVDPHLSTPAFLTGTDFRPGNVPIVHHAIVFAIAPEQAAAARAKDAASGGRGWTCFGNDPLGSGAQLGSTWVDTWTPGASETLLQQDVGFPLRPGALLVFQIHYNLLATGGKAGPSDQSSVRLRLTNGTPATKPLMTQPLLAPIELPCPAGQSGVLCDRTAAIADVAQRFGPDVGDQENSLVARCSGGTPVPGDVQHCDYPVPFPVTVYAALGHMHMLGRSIKIELNPGTPKAQTLLDVPAFNFDDQRLTPEPTPVAVNPGDTVRVTCTHDPTLRQELPALSKLPPRYVVWGDGTSDEMCLGLLTIATGH